MSRIPDWWPLQSDEPITPARHRHDETLAIGSLVEFFSQCGNVDLDIVLLHSQAGPYRVKESILGHNVPLRQREDTQNIQRAAT